MNLTCKGKCSRCGGCCMPCVPITLEEYYKIKDYIKENDIPYEVPQPYFTSNGQQEIDLRCCFYDKKNKKCKIYDVRPEVCRSYSCCLSENILEHNRYYYDKRADINGNHLDRLIPFDLLFYGSPITALLLPRHIGKSEYTKKKLLSFLLDAGKDRTFIDKYKLNSTWDVIDGIKNKQIVLEWENE